MNYQSWMEEDGAIELDVLSIELCSEDRHCRKDEIVQTNIHKSSFTWTFDCMCGITRIPVTPSTQRPKMLASEEGCARNFTIGLGTYLLPVLSSVLSTARVGRTKD